MRQTLKLSVCAVSVCCAALFGPSVPFAAAQDTRVSGGLYVRAISGNFGGSGTTSMFYAPAVLRVDTGKFEIAGFFPYLSIKNGAGVLSEGGWIPAPGSVNGSPNVGATMGAGMMGGSGMMGGVGGQQSGTSTTVSSSAPAFARRSGFGDVAASIGYRLVDNILTGVQFVASGRVKVPTASASNGLGTGRPDVGAALALRKRYDSGWVYGEIGYVLVGQPAANRLRNAVTWSVGGGRQLSSRVFLLVSGFGNSAVVPGYQPPAEVGAGLGFRLADHLNFTIVPSVGLTHASPHYGVTVGLSTELWRR